MFLKIRNTLLATVIAVTGAFPANAAVFSGENGQFFFRYKDTEFVAVTPPDSTAKDVTAYFIGGVGFDFSELLPLRQEWEDDLWHVTSGSLPEGITFNSGTRKFEGKPTEAAKGAVVFLSGVDANGNEVADAKVTFDVYDIVGKPVKADLYAHAGKYKLDELAIPAGLTVDSWERVAQYSPPPGVTINGPYFEGTPAVAGQWQYMIYGKNYKGEIVVTFWGNYLVEDKPTFPVIADMIYKLPQAEYGYSLGPFDFGAPRTFAIKHMIDPAKQARYFLEIDPSSAGLPGAVVSNDNAKDLRLYGNVSAPYDTAKVRFRAVDSDGTEGYSNWFTFGSSDPQPICNPNAGNYPIVVYTGRKASVSIPKPFGGQGQVEYFITSGTLPSDLSLDKDTGLISGIAKTAGDNKDVSIRVDVTNGQDTVSTTCAYRFEVQSGGLTVADATDQQAKHVRVGDVYTGHVRIDGGIPDYELSFTDPSALPGMAFTTASKNATDVTVSAVAPAPGASSIGLSLLNGDGTTKTGNLNITAHGELAIGTVPAIHIKRLGSSKVWGSIPYDAATVIPDVKNGDQPKFVLSNQGGLPAGIALNDGGEFSGATNAVAKSYGTFTAAMSDYSGDSVQSNAFEVVVDPRDEIAAATPVEPNFIIQKGIEQTATPVTFKQPEGASSFKVDYALVNLSNKALPAWLSFDTATGTFTASAGIPYEDIGPYGPYAVKATDTDNSSTTSDTFEVRVRDWEDPRSTVTAVWRGTVSGNTAVGEASTVLNIPGNIVPTLSNFIDANTVIGGSAGVTYTGSTPSNPAGLGAIAADGVFAGVPTEEFNGKIDVDFKDSKGRMGTMQLPLEVRPYPSVRMDQSEYDLPIQTRAETLANKIQGRQVRGFWNAPVWSLDTSKGNPLPSHPSDTDTKRLHVDPESGMIVGSTKAAVGTRVDNIILKATSAGANAGERLESWTAPFSIVITARDEIGLTYNRQQVVYYLVEDGNGGLKMSQSNPTVSPVATTTGSYEAPLTYTLSTADAVAAGMTGTLGINAQNGNLTGYPTTLGEWVVKANVTDNDGLSPSEYPLTIKATLDGGINLANGGGAFKLRQDQKFNTSELNISNAVGNVVFSHNPGALQGVLDFDATTGAFLPSSHFESPVTGYSVTVDAKDDDNRTFASEPPQYAFTVIGPLTASTSISGIAAKQYAPAENGGINVTSPISISNVMKSVSYKLVGDLPGTLVNRTYDGNGVFVSWDWKDEDGTAHTLPAATPVPEAQLPADALVFDTKDASLKGSPSKVGTFPGLTIKATDSQIDAYDVDKAGLDVSANRTKYNTATVGPFSITVAPAAALALVTPVSPDTTAALIANADVEDFAITSENEAWGRAIPAGKWTVDSSHGLPPGVTVVAEDGRVVVKGTPTLTGTFGPVSITATDSLGRVATTGLTLRVIEPSDEIQLNVASTVTTRANVPFSVQATATNTYGKVSFYSYDIDGNPKTHVPGQFANDMDIGLASGKVTGSFATVGDRNFDIWVSDATKRLTSKTVTVSVIPDLRVTVPTQVAAQQAVKLSRTVDTAYKIGTVSYQKGTGDWPVGIDVDPATGSIFSKFVDPTSGEIIEKVQAAAGTYPGLTIVAVDTYTVDGVTYNDRQSSNEFAIVVDFADVLPEVATPAKTILGVQGTAISNWRPVVKDNVDKKTWNYANTTYKLSTDLTQYGLSFDKNSGIISGTATTPFIVRDMVLTVTSQRGDSSSTAPFWIGVAPKDPMVVDAAQKKAYKWRMNAALATDPVVVSNVVGNLTFSKPATPLTGWDATNGVLSNAAWTNVAWVQNTVPYSTTITDEFNRTLVWSWTADFLNDLVPTSAQVIVSPKATISGSKVATVASGVYGTVSYDMTGLPLGLSFNSATGLVSGTLDDKYVDGDLIHVTVTVTDSYDGAARTTSFDYKVMLGYMYWRLNDSVTPAGNTWPGVYWGELKLFDKSGASLAVSGSAAVDKLISSPDVFNNPTDSNPGRVFDGDQRTGMIFGADGNGVRYIGVKFKQPQSIGSVYVSLAKPVLTSDFNWVAMYFPAVPVNFKIEASGDGVTWTTMYTASFTGVGGGLNRTQWDATYVLP